jgi:hypothetical protein
MTGTDLMPSGAVMDTFTGANNAAPDTTNWSMSYNTGAASAISIQSNQCRLRTGATNGNRISMRLLTASVLGMEVLFDWVVTSSGSSVPAVWFHTGTTQDTAYGHYFTLSDAGMDVGYSTVASPYNTVGIGSYSHGFVVGQAVRTRIACFTSGSVTTLKARTWLQSGTENTNVWQISTTDAHVLTGGYTGLTHASFSAGSKDFFIDNFDAWDTETPTAKTIAVGGSITVTGALVKSMPKLFSGSITATGALAKTRVVVRAFSGSITATGTFSKFARKKFAGSVIPSGLFAKRTGKVFSGSITATGTSSKFARKKFAGSITAVSDLTLMSLGRIFGVPGIVVVTVRKAGELRARFRRT